MRRGFLPVIGLAALLGLISGCGDRESAASDDLGAAGYSMTAGDFFRAARAGDKAVIGRFLEGGFDIETRDDAGDSVIHAAAAAGQDEMVDYLLDRGMSVDSAGAGGATPLAAAVAAGKAGTVRYLLRNGADPERRDGEGFKPLMLAVKSDRVQVVEELAPHVRQDLDTALLMAALLGKPEMINALTNYGASVYARTDDGRTALMVAAEQGQLGAARMLVDIGANRFAVDGEGRIAAELAEVAGHAELAGELRATGSESAFGLEEPVWPEEKLVAMEDGAVAPDGLLPGGTVGRVPVDPRAAGVAAGGMVVATDGADAEATGTPRGTEADGAGVMPWNRPNPGEGAGLSGELVDGGQADSPAAKPRSIQGATVSGKAVAEGPPVPAIAMRRYREPALPMRVESTSPGAARVRMLAGPAGPAGEVEVAEGARVPGSRLKVVRIERRVDHSKLNNGQSADVSVVEVEDVETGLRRELVAGVPATAHDPMALVEDEASGCSYLVRSGDRFRSDDGAGYSVIGVRPNQVVLEHLGSGETITLPLRGPRG